MRLGTDLAPRGLRVIIRHTAPASNPRVHILRSMPEEFADFAPGKLLKRKIYGRFGAALDQ